MTKYKHIQIGHLFLYLTLMCVLIIYLFPVFWMVSTSFKYNIEIMTHIPVWIPHNVTFSNYSEVLIGGAHTLGSMRGILNSFIIASVTTILAIIVAIPAAYSFSRYKFKGSKNLSFWILSIRMFPPAASIIPLFLFMKVLKIIDSHFALIITYLVFNLPFAVWMIRGFFDEIPRDLNESAMIDGCSEFGSLWRILVPVVTPGIAATAIFCFMFSWNEFLFALILTRIQAQTLPVQITGFMGVKGIEWGKMCALAILGNLPVLLLGLSAQKYLVKGLTFGAVKG